MPTKHKIIPGSIQANKVINYVISGFIYYCMLVVLRSQACYRPIKCCKCDVTIARILDPLQHRGQILVVPLVVGSHLPRPPEDAQDLPLVEQGLSCYIVTCNNT